MRLSLAMLRAALCAAPGIAVATDAAGASLYLGRDLISVRVDEARSRGTFNNTFAGGATIEKAIDAPSADAEERHNQSTHIWFTAQSPDHGLTLVFDLRRNYDISMLHFWNYTAEDYDVDEIMFTFFGESGNQVGRLTVEPALGSSPGIRAEDIPLAAPLSVRRVEARLSGSNGQIDFQNIGFIAVLSEPGPALDRPASSDAGAQ